MKLIALEFPPISPLTTISGFFSGEKPQLNGLFDPSLLGCEAFSVVLNIREQQHTLPSAMKLIALEFPPISPLTTKMQPSSSLSPRKGVCAVGLTAW
jgi:hypothetical protein